MVIRLMECPLAFCHKNMIINKNNVHVFFKKQNSMSEIPGFFSDVMSDFRLFVGVNLSEQKIDKCLFVFDLSPSGRYR